MIALLDNTVISNFSVVQRIPISGTLGLLLMLVDADVLTLSAAHALLARMVQAGYCAPFQSLAKLL